MDALSDLISVTTFWRICLFLHFFVAVALLAAVTLQAVAVSLPAQETAGGGMAARLRPVPAASYVIPIIVLYIANFLLGAWVYTKYRTYVRIPMEQLAHWWTVGSFEFKEHVVTMGVALLPAYWYFWRTEAAQEHALVRRWITIFLAATVWYAFLAGHVANDFRGVGS